MSNEPSERAVQTTIFCTTDKIQPMPPSKLYKVGRMIRIGASGRVTTVPFIRLSGKWLENAGFHSDDYLAVTVHPGAVGLVSIKQGTR